MAKKLTPFQLWSLIKLYDSGKLTTSSDLVRNCCESALMTLDENNSDKELMDLADKEYIRMDEFTIEYIITNKGIIFVRKKITKIQDACNQDKISKEIIENQDKELRKAIKDKVGNLLPIIIKCAIKDIGPIIELSTGLA